MNCIFIFSFENNNINLNKLEKNITLKVKEIDLNGGERREIYFYENGEVEDVFFDEWNSNIYVENFIINDKKLINFINNFSLEAINSVKNDKIIFKQNFKRKKLKFSKDKIKFDYVGKFFGRNEGEISFNKKNKIINYRRVYSFSNDSLIVPKDNVKLYEIIYKNKRFYIIDDKSEYKNKEIKILIDLVSFPLFLREEVKKDTKNSNKNFSNINIEIINLLNDVNNNYISYKIIGENKIEKVSYNETSFFNQFDIEKEELILDKETMKELKKNIENLKLNDDNKLEDKNNIIYKIYDEFHNLNIVTSDINIFEKIERKSNKRKISIENIISISNDNIKNLKEKKIIIDNITISKENDYDYYLKMNGRKDRILLKDYSIKTEDEHEMEIFVKDLRNNWNYEGFTPKEKIEDIANLFKKFRDKDSKYKHSESDFIQSVESLYKTYDVEN